MLWRDVLKIHPAADLFPLLSEPELKELAEDIKANGLRAPIVNWNSSEGQSLLDGRNRLDALAQLSLLYETIDHHVGLKKWDGNRWTDRPGGRIGYAPGCEVQNLHDGDPYAIALSLNVHRRHLTTEQKRELIDKLLTAKPELSDRQIGKIAKADGKTVAARRTKKESRAEIPHVETRTDTKGRQQPATKQTTKAPRPKKIPEQKPEVRSTGNDVDTELSAKARRAEMAALAEPDKATTSKAPVEVVATVITVINTLINAASKFPNGLLNSLPLDDLKTLAPDLHRARQWLDKVDDAARSHLRKKKKVS